MRIIIIPVILIIPLPNFFINQTYKLALVPRSSLSLNSQEEVKVDSSAPFSASFLSKIASRFVGGEFIKPHPISICFENDSIRNPANFPLSEASTTKASFGALELTVLDHSQSMTTNNYIYTDAGTTTCRIFASGNLTITGEIKFHSMIAIEENEGKQHIFMPINTRNSQVRVRVNFDLGEYLFEVIISTLFIGILIDIFKTYKDFFDL